MIMFNILFLNEKKWHDKGETERLLEMLIKNTSKVILNFYLICIIFFPKSVLAERPVPLIAESCSSCHGKKGISEHSIPSIVGLSQSELIEILNKYKNGELLGTIMNRLATGLTEEDIETLAKYFGS